MTEGQSIMEVKANLTKQEVELSVRNDVSTSVLSLTPENARALARHILAAAESLLKEAP